MKTSVTTLLACTALGIFAGIVMPKSLSVQAGHLTTLLTCSDDADRGSFVLSRSISAQLDAAGFQKVIIESDGSGIAISSLNHFTGFWDRQMADAAQRVVLVKRANGWIAKRDCQYEDVDTALASAVGALADYTNRRRAHAS